MIDDSDDTPPSLIRWLDAEARARGVAPADARVLAVHALGITRTQLAMRDGPPADAAPLRALLERRAAGEPVAYLVGGREFHGRVFRATPAVLIPRPETETLVDVALAFLDERPGPARVLDLGTGTGAIAVTLALERPGLDVTATDASPDALDVARGNAAALGARARLLAGDWYGALPPGEPPFDLVVSNPPYIASDDAHLERGDLRFEPRGALTDGEDGLQALRRIVAGAARFLRPGGLLAVEHGWDQGEAVRGLLREAGFTRVDTARDLAGIERVGIGRLPG